MRTIDFSRAPAIGQATAQFVGGTRFAGPLSFIELYRRWRPMIRLLKKSPGYRGHHVWYGFPFTLGTIAFFADREAMLEFARSPEHAELMRWVMEPGKARGGFIRFYDVAPHGYSSGVWRAEPPHVMRAIDYFTPLPGEEQGPPVRPSSVGQPPGSGYIAGSQYSGTGTTHPTGGDTYTASTTAGGVATTTTEHF